MFSTHYYMENAHRLNAIFSTDCMFGFGAACPMGVNLLSPFCFQAVDTTRFQNRFPPDQWENALAFFTASTEQVQ